MNYSSHAALMIHLDYINKVDYNALNGGRFEEYFRNMPEDILPDFLKGITKNKEFICEVKRQLEAVQEGDL